MDTVDLEALQEDKLHTNWQIRKDFAVEIGSFEGYTIFKVQVIGNSFIVYSVQNGVPVGYVRCNDDGFGWTVSSTYFSSHVRQKGLGTAVYKTIIGHIPRLTSDWERTDGANALWRKLARDRDLVVWEEESLFFARVK